MVGGVERKAMAMVTKGTEVLVDLCDTAGSRAVDQLRDLRRQCSESRAGQRSSRAAIRDTPGM